MKAEISIDHETKNVKLLLNWKDGNVGKRLTADEAENVVKLIEDAVQTAGREAFREWLMQSECREDVIVIGGKTYRFKMDSQKEFLTKLGAMTVSRRMFQQDTGGPTYMPLDVAWEMDGEFATREVRECVLYMSSLMIPAEVEECLQKATFGTMLIPTCCMMVLKRYWTFIIRWNIFPRVRKGFSASARRNRKRGIAKWRRCCSNMTMALSE